MDRPGPALGIAERARLWQVPDLFPIMLSPEANELVLVPVTRQAYRDASFLDDREIPTTGSRVLPLDEAIRLLDRHPPPAKPVHGIFHVAFCGSTLISRCLQELDTAFVLKEPFPLHAMAERRRKIIPGSPAEATWRRQFRLLLRLLSRTHRPQQTAIVKPTDASTNLMCELLEHHPGSRAVFLHVGIEEFMLALLGDRERMGFVRSRLAELGELFPDEAVFRLERWSSLPDAAQVACLWMLHARVHARYAGPNRTTACRSLDFARFRRAPVATLAGLVGFLGLEATTPAIEQAVATCIAVDSKRPGLRYSNKAWLRRRRETERLFRSDLRAGLEWAERHFPDFHELQMPASPLE